MKRFVSWVIVLSVFLVPLCNGTYKVPPDAKGKVKTAWKAFFNNEDEQALNLFQKAAGKKRKNKAALRGLILVGFLDGEFDVMFDALERLISLDPNDLHLLGYMNFLLQVPFNPDWANKEIRILKMLRDKCTRYPELRFRSTQYLGLLEMQLNHLDKGRSYINELKSIQNWALLGPFENISDVGMDQEPDPDLGVDMNRRYKGRNGIEIEWLEHTFNDKMGWVFLEDYFDYAADTMVYAQTGIYTDKPRDLLIGLGYSGSIRTYFNGFKVLEVMEHQNTDMDHQIIPIHLEKGWNRLLIQLGSTQSHLNFYAHLFTPEGKIAKDLVIKGIPTDEKGFTKVSSENNRTQPLARTFLHPIETYIVDHPDDLEMKTIFLIANGTEGCIDDVNKWLPELKREKPEWGVTYLVEMLKYLLTQNELESMRATELALEKNFRLLLPRSMKLQNLLGSDRNDEARKLSEKTLKIYPNSLYGNLIRIVNEIKEKGEEEGLKELVDLWRKYPANESLFYILNLIYSSKNRIDELTQLAMNCRNYWPKDQYARQVLVATYLRTGQVAKAETVCKKIIQLHPDFLLGYALLNKVYTVTGKYEDSLKMLEQAEKNIPYNTTLYDMKVKVLQNLDREDEVKVALRRLLAIDPYRFESRENLYRIEKEPLPLELIPSVAVDDILKQKEKETDSIVSDAQVVILLNEHRRVIYEDGATEEEVIQGLHIRSEQVIDDFSQYQIPFNPVYQNLKLLDSKLVKADGEQLEVRRYANGIGFPGLEKGDVLYIHYKLQDKRNWAGLARHVWQRFTPGTGYPTLNAKYVLISKPDFPVAIHYRNGAKPGLKQEKNGWVLNEWMVENIPQYDDEFGSPAYADVLPGIEISTIESWKSVSDWYAHLTRKKCKVSVEIQRKSDELTEGLTSDIEKQKAIYQFVAREIHYLSDPFEHSSYIPRDAEQVLRDKQGDCKDMATLLIALFKAAGIDAKYALLNVQNNLEGYVSPCFDFNHCIVAMPSESGYKWFDPTSGYTDFAEPSDMDYGVPALVIGTGELHKVWGHYPRCGEIHINTSVSIDLENSRQTIRAKQQYSGVDAESKRLNWSDMTDKERKQQFTEIIHKKHSGGKLIQLDIPNLERLDQPLRFNFEYVADLTNTPDEDLFIYNLPWQMKLAHSMFGDVSTRKFPFYPYLVTYSGIIEETISVEIPTGWSLMKKMKDVTLDGPDCHFEIKYELSGNKLIGKEKIMLPARKLSVEEVALFKQFLEKMERMKQKAIIFAKD